MITNISSPPPARGGVVIGKTALVNERHFVHATRDTGYKSTTAAVAELIDNAVQAGASAVHVVIAEERVDGVRQVRVAVLDNGSGMTGPELKQALQFGGSTRFNDRSGLGRFGMGLPNASVSQARRVEVFTWRSSRRLWSYLDLDEIAAGRLAAVPDAQRGHRLPEWAKAMPTGKSGTLVVWMKCDRLDHRKASTIVRKLCPELGRLFRHALQDRLKITVNGKDVPLVDPLFRLHGSAVVGAEDYLEPLVYPIRIPGTARGSANVTVRFAKLPVRKWAALPADEKRRMGIVGGAGVFVVRARREIAHGWYFMQGKARQNYDDWWRCEVEFPPCLDELFGVTHSKQGIRPSQELNDILGPEIGRVARQLSQETRSAFAKEPRKPRSAAAGRASQRDWRLPRLGAVGNKGASTMEHLRYEVALRKAPDAVFFDWTRKNGTLVVTLNESHPFYSELMARVAPDELAWIRRDLETVLIAYARAAEMHQQDTASFRAAWGDVLSAFMGS